MGRVASVVGLAVAIAAWGAGTAVLAEVSGTCTYRGQRVALIDGVAWTAPPAAKAAADAAPTLRLGLATFGIDQRAMLRAGDRDAAFGYQAASKDRSGRFELTIRGGVVIQHYLWISPGVTINLIRNRVGQYKPGAAEGGRVRGAYRFTPGDGQNLSCQIAFDVPILSADGGAVVALPTDGGAPGAAYLALNRALHADDIDAMIRLLPADRAAEMRDARDAPDFVRTMNLIRAISPTQVKVTGGRQEGERAWVEFTAMEGREARVGLAEMKLEGGRWVSVREDLRKPD